jgi:hypothetical protein
LPNSRSQDFRFVFANTFSVSFGQAEAQLIFGIQTNPGTQDVTMEEQVGLITTHPATKLLVQMLAMIIEAHEKATGVEIQVDPARLEQIKQALAAGDAARAAALSKNQS